MLSAEQIRDRESVSKSKHPYLELAAAVGIPRSARNDSHRVASYLLAGTAQNLSNAFLSSAAMSAASRCSMSLRCIM